MTDTDRIDDLEREVAELRRYIQMLQQTGRLPAAAVRWPSPGSAAPAPAIGNGNTPAPEEPRVRTIKGTIEGTISE